MTTQYRLTSASNDAPKVLYAFQHIIRNFFRIEDVFAIRLGKSVRTVSRCLQADGCTLVYYLSDINPDFRFYETQDTALDIRHVTNSDKNRFMQCLVKNGCKNAIDPPGHQKSGYRKQQERSIARQIDPVGERGNVIPTTVSQEPPTPNPIDVGDDLPTIEEDDGEISTDELMIEAFCAELTSNDPLQPTDELPNYGMTRNILGTNTLCT